MSSMAFNVIISGVSVSGDIDTLAAPLRINLGNTDRIGYATFTLQNRDVAYTKMLVSGNATCQIDAVPAPGITQTVFRGTVEEAITSIQNNRGTITEITAYDLAQELLGMVSPDARLPYLLTNSGTINILSGDGGMGSLDGMELTHYVSGINQNSGATVTDFMAQYFGISGNITGSNSGLSFSFKPYVSGYTWNSYYVPDASGFVRANDNNLNFWIQFDTFKVKREYAWDILRKLSRHNLPMTSGGNKVQFELYIDVSGGIHFFTSGSYEFVASGVTFQYYQAGNSGSSLNNILDAKLPFNTASVKNYILGNFPAWTTYPTDRDFFSDFVAYSGAQWSGSQRFRGVASLTLSGNNPAPGGIGMISIWGIAGGGLGGTFGRNLTYTLSGSLNIQKWNISGSVGVALNYLLRKNTSGYAAIYEARQVYISDTSGFYIQKFGSGSFLNLTVPVNASGPWMQFTEPIYTASGTFFSGNGQDGGWNPVSGLFPPSGCDLTRVNSITIGIASNLADSNSGGEVQVDNVYFSFGYPFSPVVAINSGSIGMGYGRRYSVVEFPYQVTDIGASGIINQELNSRMGQKGIASLVVKDNPAQPFSYQLALKPGQVFLIDAPSLNTGSGQTFYTWKALDVQHEWSAKEGFKTIIKAVPWYSGTIANSQSNLIDYELPLRYSPSPPPPKRNQYMPINYPWQQTGPR